MKTFAIIGVCLALTAIAFVWAGGGKHGPATRPAGKARDGKATKPMPELNEFEKYVILKKGTERPFTGKYHNHFEKGTYVCRKCGAPLYRSDSKFKSECGWPSFDDEIKGAVKRTTDADGVRTEITCAACGGHLGHVFLGEGFTTKNTRHCVNSVSLVFRAAPKLRKAIFAGGCFWGVEHLFQQIDGVQKAVSGYTGGTAKDPTYKQVCTGDTGHAEAVEVTYDANKVSYEALAKYFFEIHDPTQLNRQGPDFGTQYRSAVFYSNDEEKAVAEKLIALLKKKGYKVVTQVVQAGTFYPAEDYHQDYFVKHPARAAHCHAPVKRFDTPVK